MLMRTAVRFYLYSIYHNWEQGHAHLSSLGYVIMGVFPLRQGITYTYGLGSIGQKRLTLSNQIAQVPHQEVEFVY